MQRRRLIAVALIVGLAAVLGAVGLRQRRLAASSELRRAASRSEERAASEAEKEWKLRDLQRRSAVVQLELVDLVVRRAARRGPTPVGLVEYQQLLSAPASDARGDGASLIDASIEVRADDGGASRTVTWTALLRLAPGGPGEWGFDRVLRTAAGTVYVGWTKERGIDASMMPLEEIPAAASAFAAAAGAEDVVWCTLEAYQSEDAYHPGAPALFDDPAALRALWIEAFEVAGRDATVMASRGAVPELVVTDDSGQSPLLGGAGTLAYYPLVNTVEIQRRGVRAVSASSGLDMVSDTRVLQLSLIHEAVHAHDYASSPALLAAARSEDSERARAAKIVVEGHAAFVTERLAETLDLSAVWRRRQRALRRLWYSVRPIQPDALRAYEIGRDAMVRAFERGGCEAVRALVRAPPASEAELRGR